MTSADESSTNLSLISTLFSSPGDTEIGLAFLEKYKPILLNVARSRGLRDQDAEDVAQDALRKMLAGFHNFRRVRKGSFRAWLRTIAHSASIDWFEEHPRLDADLMREMAREVPHGIALEYETELMEAAIRKVKLEVNPQTWDYFERTRVHGEEAKVVAGEFGVSIITVYNGAQRVATRLRELYDLFDHMHQE